MKIKYLHLLLFAILFTSLYGQIQGPVTNVSIKISDEQDKVTIYYDLARNSKITYYSIKAMILVDGERVEAKGLSGDVGNQILAGLGKKIIWDVHQDLTELSGELKIEVLTDTKTGSQAPCMPIKSLSAYAGLGGVALSGLGIIIIGLTKEKDSKEIYDIYKNNLDPASTIYTDLGLSREEHYDEANKKHKQGGWLTAGGATILLGGGYIFVSRLIKIRNYNKDCAKKTANLPLWDLKPDVAFGSSAKRVGFIFNYRF